VHKTGSLALAIDPFQNRWWDKGKIYLGEKTSQDLVMPDALPSPVFRHGYEVQKEEKISSAHICCLDRRDHCDIKILQPKGCLCSKHLQTVQQRSKFPSPKNLLSLKYPKRGMSL